jgi:hypothetical protein
MIKFWERAVQALLVGTIGFTAFAMTDVWMVLS